MTKLNNKWQTVRGDKLFDGVSGDVTFQFIPALVEFLQQDNTLFFGTQLGPDSRFGSDGERYLVVEGSSFQESLCRVTLQVGEETGDHDSGRGLILLCLISRRQCFGSRSCLLVQPLDNVLRGPAAAVLHGFAITEEFDRRIASDFVLLRQFTLFSGINFGQNDF